MSNRLIVLIAFSSLLVVVVVVVPVAAVAFALVMLFFALIRAFLAFALFVPCLADVHWFWSLVVACL